MKPKIVEIKKNAIIIVSEVYSAKEDAEHKNLKWVIYLKTQER